MYPDMPQIFFNFESRMSSDGSSSDSSSSSNSSSSSSSSSDNYSSVLKSSTRKFVFSKSKSTGLSKWIITGIGDEKIKECREIYKPTLKRKADLLTNPSLDESIYIRLRAEKGSNATRGNVYPTEKVLKKLSF